MIFNFLTLLIYAHSFHVSNFDVRLNRNNSSVEVVGRIFHDDLEYALKKTFNLFRFDIKADHQLTDHYLKRYFLDRLNMSSPNKIVHGNWVGHKFKGNSIVIYMEYPLHTSISNFNISINSLTEFYEDQKNILHLYDSDLIQTTIIDRKGMTVSHSW